MYWTYQDCDNENILIALMVLDVIEVFLIDLFGLSCCLLSAPTVQTLDWSGSFLV